MKKIMETLYSEKGMNVVNTLFFLSLFFYRSRLLFIAYIAWIVYLSFCIKQADTKAAKLVFSVFTGIAAVMICVNLYFLVKG